MRCSESRKQKCAAMNTGQGGSGGHVDCWLAKNNPGSAFVVVFVLVCRTSGGEGRGESGERAPGKGKMKNEESKEAQERDRHRGMPTRSQTIKRGKEIHKKRSGGGGDSTQILKNARA